MGRDVAAMFDDIAPAYDRTNAVLSFGVHTRWRRQALRAACVLPGDTVLDVATGTGGLAAILRKRAHATGRVVGLDFSAGMLAVAKRRRDGMDWVRGDAMRLPLRDASVSAATIAFGIRNVDDVVQALAEMRRVLRPGGRLVVLEFGQPKGPVAWPFAWYSRHVMPRIGGLLTGNRAAYEYLPQTASRFACGDDFVALLRQAGDFASVEARPLTGGIAWLYTAVR